MAVTTVRAFLAIELSEAIRSEASQFLKTIQSQFPQFRFIDPENWHLTLHFFGQIEPEKIEKLKSRLTQDLSVVKPFPISLEGFGMFPSKRNPHILWIGVKEGVSELSNLKKHLDQSLQKMHFQVENRPFHPHVSVARSKDQILTSTYKTMPDFKGQMVDQIRSIMLFRSDLFPEGPRYTSLATLSLGIF